LPIPGPAGLAHFRPDPAISAMDNAPRGNDHCRLIAQQHAHSKGLC
jgi:hypothetical protein